MRANPRRKAAFVVVAALLLTPVGLAGGSDPTAPVIPPAVPPVIVPTTHSSRDALASCEADLDRCEGALDVAEAKVALQNGAPVFLTARPAGSPTALPAAPVAVEPPLLAPTDAPLPVPALAKHGAVVTGEHRAGPGLDQVAAITKGMKPKAAAAVAAGWDDALTVDVLGRLPPRQAAELVAALPAEVAARVTARLARDGLPTPKPDTSGPRGQRGGTP